MKAFARLISRMFEDRPTRTYYSEWDRQREMARQFGPSHVAEIDAIFQRGA